MARIKHGAYSTREPNESNLKSKYLSVDTFGSRGKMPSTNSSTTKASGGGAIHRGATSTIKLLNSKKDKITAYHGRFGQDLEERNSIYHNFNVKLVNKEAVKALYYERAATDSSFKKKPLQVKKNLRSQQGRFAGSKGSPRRDASPYY